MHPALAVLAVAPQALGGLRWRERAGPSREAMLAALRDLLPPGTPWCRLPVHAGDEALHGGLDLAATLAVGELRRTQGLLNRARGGLLVAAMAERMSAALAGRLAAALDGDDAPALLLLDEGLDADERASPALCDRLALQLEPGPAAQPGPVPDAGRVAAARRTWRQVEVPDALLQALVGTAAAWGAESARGPWLALQVTRILAALDGRAQATEDDARQAAAWVLVPRATRVPPAPADEPLPPPEPPPPEKQDAADAGDDEPPPELPDQPLQERVIEAVRAALPPALLASLAAAGAAPSRRGDAGRSGQSLRGTQRGRPVGARRGTPRDGSRLALVDTLRAAAPWQRVRRAEAGDPLRVQVRRDDLRVQQRVQRRSTTTVFAIDASGSQALHRLAEAKGAVELLLADCYARRDRVAVVGFRGAAAQLLLPPTRSLVRARRQLAGLPGGGGTPLAAGIDEARRVTEAVQRGGGTALVVLLTDGRANIARDGRPGRDAALQDALASARALAATGAATLVVDTSPQPGPAAPRLAEALRGRCVVLPLADARRLSQAVRVQHDAAGGRND